MAVPGPYSRALLDMLDEPILLIEANRIMLANAPAEALFGSGFLGRDVRLLLRQPALLAALAAGQDQHVEVQGLGGYDRRWDVHVRPAGADAIFLRFSDVSTRHAVESMRADFVANASHELRTPLAAILGYAETLADDAPLSEPLRSRFAGKIHEQAKRMQRLIEDLMSLSQISADRFVPPSDRVDLAAVVRRVVDDHRAEAEDCGASITLALDSDVLLSGARAQLEQLVDNLVGNALRYGCGTPGAHVEVGLVIDDGDAILTVNDSGPGIAAEHLPRLTERFYRVDPARSRAAGGTGLGLAIVKHIVERHRGRLDIASEPGRGTTFTVRLPRA